MRRGGGCAEEEDAEVRVRVLHAYTALSRILNDSAMYGSVKTSGSCPGMVGWILGLIIRPMTVRRLCGHVLAAEPGEWLQD